MTSAPGPVERPVRASRVERVCSAGRGLLSEGPRWDADRAELIWVDVLAREVHTLNAGRHIGTAAPAAAGGYVLAAAGHVLRTDGLGVTGPPCPPYRGPVSTP